MHDVRKSFLAAWEKHMRMAEAVDLYTGIEEDDELYQQAKQD